MLGNLLAAIALTSVAYSLLITRPAVVVLMRIGHAIERASTEVGFSLNSRAAMAEKERQAALARKRADDAQTRVDELKRLR